MKTMQIGSLAELPDAAEEIIRSLGGRTIVAFRGEMGAGKTTLIREIAARLGSDDVVTSPTFAIINQYAAAEAAPSTISTSIASTVWRRPTTSATRSISTRAICAWWSGPRKSSRCSLKTP